MSSPLHHPSPSHSGNAAATLAPAGLFDYELPPKRIALYPAAERDASRLLVVERHGSRLEHRVFRDLPSLLEPGDLLVLNDSRVFPARLRGRRPGGGEVEVLLTERIDAAGAGRGAGPRPTAAAGGEIWAVLARAAGKIRPGDEWDLGGGLAGRVIGRRTDERLEVELRAARPVLDVASERGETPLPPYIHRPVDPAVDPQRYQTVYARTAGSCAAPTAGLHFTPALFDELARRGVRTASLTLHVGWATFRPMRPGDPVPPPVPPEPYVLPEETAAAVQDTRRQGGRVIAVGTTSARVLESCAMDAGGAKAAAADAAGSGASTAGAAVSNTAAWRAKAGGAERSRLEGPRAGAGACALTIVPGHRFRAIDGLLTNFHLPRTTLLMLVAAFGGEAAVRAAYAEALRDGYRFYSYGDAMLILGRPPVGAHPRDGLGHREQAVRNLQQEGRRAL